MDKKWLAIAKSILFNTIYTPLNSVIIFYGISIKSVESSKDWSFIVFFFTIFAWVLFQANTYYMRDGLYFLTFNTTIGFITFFMNFIMHMYTHDYTVGIEVPTTSDNSHIVVFPSRRQKQFNII